MSWLTDWWKKGSTQIIVQAGLQILKALAGEIAKDLWTIAVNSATKANDMPLSSDQKAKYVLQDIKASIPSIKDSVANLALELAVSYIKAGLTK